MSGYISPLICIALTQKKVKIGWAEKEAQMDIDGSTWFLSSMDLG